MKDSYLKCINLFTTNSTQARVLVINTKDTPVETTVGEHDSNIAIISERYEEKLKPLLNQFKASTKIGTNNNCLYDLIILDQVCDAPLLQLEFNAIWHTRQEMIQSLSEVISPNGGLVILAKNTTNLRKASYFFNAIINQIVRTKYLGSFYHQYSSELENATFKQLDRFYVLPNFKSFSNLVSAKQNAGFAFMLHLHGFSLGIPRQPRRWLRWLAVRLGLDFLLISEQLLWARK